MAHITELSDFAISTICTQVDLGWRVNHAKLAKLPCREGTILTSMVEGYPFTSCTIKSGCNNTITLVVDNEGLLTIGGATNLGECYTQAHAAVLFALKYRIPAREG